MTDEHASAEQGKSQSKDESNQKMFEQCAFARQKIKRVLLEMLVSKNDPVAIYEALVLNAAWLHSALLLWTEVKGNDPTKVHETLEALYQQIQKDVVGRPLKGVADLPF
jgi:hypothetical protein